MSETAQLLSRSAIRVALAREAYGRGESRIADPNIAEYRWLVASPEGIFGVTPDSAKKVIYGRFFGICRHHDMLYLFEKCAPRGETAPWGRIVRFELAGGRLTAPAAIANGLDNQCHQIAVIDGLLCVVDTANQAIRRFTLDGGAVDVLRPLPPGLPGDASGAYLHINAIAKVGDRIAIMLHNGSARPLKNSELAWLDSSWKLVARDSLPGHSCHDIVEDERGILWHSASMSGEIIGSDGTRVKITDAMMTRGIAFTKDAVIVGMSTFGPRHVRDELRGGLVILDRDLSRKTEISIHGAPTDIVAL